MSGLFGGGSNSGVAGGLPTGVKLAAAALLAHQLMKHSQAEQGVASAEPSGGGGLGGLLGGLRDQGLGHKVESWVGHGENHPVAPHEVERAFDPSELDEAARRAGTDRGTLLDELSRMLPGMVDGMTPQGRLPQRGEEIGGGIGGLLGRLLGAGGR